VSAASIGESLSFRAAARLAPADQTNGLTLHANQGLSAALHRALSRQAHDVPAPVVEPGAGSRLGAQLTSVRRTSLAPELGFARDAAILGGTWNGLNDRPAPWQRREHAVGGASGVLDEVDAAGLDVTASVGR
jgi:hypothetical protein